MSTGTEQQRMADFLSFRSQLLAERAAGAFLKDLAVKYGVTQVRARAWCREAVEAGDYTQYQLGLRNVSRMIATVDEYNQKWIERVRANCDVTETGCWAWKGSRNAWGYAETSYRGKLVFVHRKIYMIVHKVDLVREQYVCHTCDVRHCFNPDHLWIGSNSDNQRDSSQKNRHYESRRTFCDRGHEFTEENTYWKTSSTSGAPARSCRECTRIRHRERNRLKKAQRLGVSP